MKFVALLIGLLTAVPSLAALDSVGVFHRPDKVVVLVTENNPQGRIQEFMSALGAEELFVWKNPDQSLSIRCGRNAREASCTFRFFPSADVQIGDKTVRALIPHSELESADFDLEFQSSMGDRFTLKNALHGIVFEASKKPAALP